MINQINLKKFKGLSFRFSAKILSNVFALAYNFIFSFLIPRALGPIGFGLFELINSNINNLINIVNGGTSGAFYTKLSQKPNDIGLIKFYSKVVLVIISILLIVIFFSIKFFDLDIMLENKNSSKYIMLGFVFCFGVYLSNILKDAADAYVITIKNEFLIIVLKGLGVLIIVYLFFSNNLTIDTLYYKEIIVIILITTASFLLLKKNWKNNFSNEYVSSTTSQLISGFWKYCNPLIVVAIFSSISLIAERWMLQIFGGSSEQGFFSLALRISSIGMLFAGALSTLLIREIAVLKKKNDIERIAILMKKSLKFMYAIVALFSLFACVFSEEIIEIMIGNKFTGAIVSLQVLSLYPLHQIYGQYTISFFMGASETGTYRNIVIFSSLFSLLATWLLVAPSNYFGLNLGGFGLAIKTVFVNLIVTNIRFLIITRKIKLSFMPFIYHQVGVVILFLIIALFCKYSIQYIILNQLYNLFISAIFYLIIIIFLLRKVPFLSGLKKEEINIYLNKFTPFKS